MLNKRTEIKLKAVDQNAERAKKLEEDKKKKEELSQLFKPVAQTVAFGMYISLVFNLITLKL